jgi:hypothetical protein
VAAQGWRRPGTGLRWWFVQGAVEGHIAGRLAVRGSVLDERADNFLRQRVPHGGGLLATSRQKQDQTSSSQIFVNGVVTVALLLGKATFPTAILAQFSCFGLANLAHQC